MVVVFASFQHYDSIAFKLVPCHQPLQSLIEMRLNESQLESLSFIFIAIWLMPFHLMISMAISLSESNKPHKMWCYPTTACILCHIFLWPHSLCAPHWDFFLKDNHNADYGSSQTGVSETHSFISRIWYFYLFYFFHRLTLKYIFIPKWIHVYDDAP